MLHVRKEQMQAFEQVALKRIEDSMVEHLRKFFPDECELLGEDGTRQTIRYGLKRAGEYGIISERDVCIYTDVMFAFGRDFDSDHQFPWAAQILNDESLKNRPSEKIDKLYEAASTNFQKAIGIKPESEEPVNE